MIRVNNFNDDYFETIDTEDKAYFLGLLFADGNVYEGDYKNGNMEGKGVLRFANGHVDEGDYKNDKKEGKGVFRYANGNVYEGDYKNGVRDGQGVMKDSRGNVTQRGTWKNGQFKG